MLKTTDTDVHLKKNYGDVLKHVSKLVDFFETRKSKQSHDEVDTFIFSKGEKAGVEIRYRYNKAGYRTEMETNDLHLVYDVDGRGRVRKITDRNQFIKITAAYDEKTGR